MISNSKILTVSYGTFSCTLEGFDDSFGTMKAIAEYFRDLAAEDRYFGAEPPTPDAEMLARIAEREIARRVEARQDGGKIVLRAQDADAANLLSQAGAESPATKAPREVSFTAAQPEKVQAPEPATITTPEASDTAVATPETAEEPADEPMADQQAAAPVSEDAVAQDMVSEGEADDSEETEAEVASVEAETSAETEEAFDEEEDLQAEDLQAEDSLDETASEPELAAFDTEETSQAEPEAPVAVQEDDIAPADPESVAAKLRRIRSVVAQSGSDFGYDYNEDEHAQDFLSSAASDLDAALAEDDAAEEARAAFDDDEDMDEDTQETEVLSHIHLQDDDDEEDDDDATSILASVRSGVAAEVAAEADIDVEEESLDEDDEFADTLAQLLADAMPATDQAEGDARRPLSQGAIDEDIDFEDDDDEDHLASESAARPLDARVIKIKRAEVEEAIASGALEAAPAENLFSEKDTIGGDDDDFDGTLSPEEEAELQRELAAVEAEYARPEAQADDIEEDDTLDDDWDEETGAAYEPDDDDEDEDLAAQAASQHPDRSLRTSEGRDSPEAYRRSAQQGVEKLQRMKQESDLSRIFDEADSQLEAPDSSKRRNAIQHLRAAVAATRADKQAGKSVDTDVDDTPYRTDLAEVVRPRRPQTQLTSRSERPGMERPAPLKLVAEQRIDTPREPIRPRRVSTQELDPSPVQGELGSSFAEFAEEMGVSSLPELLEAAAAYMADIEGRPQFSRPMLMGKLKEVEGNAFSREDSLRSFGQLLRQGKLQKLNGGRFAVTEDTDFRAPKRNVG